MDAARHRNAGDVNKQLRVYPKGPRRVFLIDNFDRAAPEFADALLKPMEAERPSVIPTTFVLVARNFSDVRAAGQSRCEVERLDPLSTVDTRLLCVRMAAANAIHFADDAALETLVIGSRGLPKLIANVCAASLHSQGLTAQQVRQILDIDWGAPIMRFWQALLTTDVNESRSDGEERLKVAKVATYSRFVLSELMGVLRSGQIGCSGEPALRLASGELLDALLHALRRRAELARLSPELLLAKLGEAIRQDDFADVRGSAELESILRTVLR